MDRRRLRTRDGDSDPLTVQVRFLPHRLRIRSPRATSSPASRPRPPGATKAPTRAATAIASLYAAPRPATITAGARPRRLRAGADAAGRGARHRGSARPCGATTRRARTPAAERGLTISNGSGGFAREGRSGMGRLKTASDVSAVQNIPQPKQLASHVSRFDCTC
jgi:hypothetical protein